MPRRISFRQSKNVSLETNQTVTVTFEDATSNVAPGTYEVTVSGGTDEVSGTLTLSMDDDGFGPGFGPVVVPAGLGGAGYLLNRADSDETDSP